MQTNENPEAVTIIGLGPMGQAMAQVFLDNRHPTTVWNRTAAKADALVAQGAIRAETVQQALAASRLVILSLTDYQAMYQLLSPATGALSGRLLVNLSSDTPQEARKATQWAARYGAQFLSGGVMVPPPLIGKPGAFVFYSGSRAILEAHQSTLSRIGKADFRGEDPGLAQLYYQALLDIMFTSAASVLHAIALIRSAGIPAVTFGPYVQDFLAFLPELFQDVAEEVDKGQYKGAFNNMNMMAAGMSHVAQASRDANINTSLPQAIKQLYDETIRMGYGQDGLTSLIEILKKP